LSSYRPRNRAELSESLHRQLNSYALAVSAAGVGMLAFAQPTEAKIVYTAANQQILPNTHYSLDLNNAGITDFTISNFYSLTHMGVNKIAELLVFPAKRNAVMSHGRTSSNYFAAALAAGVKIRANSNFKAVSMEMARSDYRQLSASFFGPWLNVTNGYLGLKFAIAGKTHYGWARLTTSCANFQCNALLTGYAYETIAGRAIIAGATSGPDDAEPISTLNRTTPNPATLGTLALGAPGLSIWRREESLP